MPVQDKAFLEMSFSPYSPEQVIKWRTEGGKRSAKPSALLTVRLGAPVKSIPRKSLGVRCIDIRKTCRFR